MRSIVRVTLAFAAAAGLAGGALAADTGVNLPAKAGEGAATALPDVAKTPSPGGPVPIPYPNIGKQTDKDAQKTKAPKSAAAKNKSHYKQSSGDEAGTVKEVILLTPLDQNTPGVAARQTLGDVPGKELGKIGKLGADKAKDLEAKLDKATDALKHKPGLLPEKAPKRPLEPVKQPVVVAPKNPVDAPPQPLPVKLGPPSIVAPPQVTPPVAAPPVQVPVVGAPVPVPVTPLPQPVVIQPVQAPQPVLQTQPVLKR